MNAVGRTGLCVVIGVLLLCGQGLRAQAPEAEQRTLAESTAAQAELPHGASTRGYGAPDPGRMRGGRRPGMPDPASVVGDPDEELDPFELHFRTIRASGDKAEELRALKLEWLGARRKALDELSLRYADRLKATLAEEQQEQYTKMLDAASEMRATIAAARAELAAKYGEGILNIARTPRRWDGESMWRYVGFTREQESQLARMRGDEVMARRALDRKMPRPTDRKDAEAVKAHFKAYREASDNIRAESTQKRKDVLTDEQRAKLDEMEAALRGYYATKQGAEAKFSAVVAEALGGR